VTTVFKLVAAEDQPQGRRPGGLGGARRGCLARAAGGTELLTDSLKFRVLMPERRARAVLALATPHVGQQVPLAGQAV
jgi:hypothetical protein